MKIAICIAIGIILFGVINYDKISYKKWYERCRDKSVCNHQWEIYKRSNVLQADDMGYPLRLCIVRCSKCGKSDQQWIDVNEKVLEELKTGESILLEWR